MGRINIILGDITKIKVDAIVNAANNMLLGGVEMVLFTELPVRSFLRNAAN